MWSWRAFLAKIFSRYKGPEAKEAGYVQGHERRWFELKYEGKWESGLEIRDPG